MASPRERTKSERAVLRKVALRLVPFMGLLYVIAFLDRVNVSYAALTMNEDIGLSAAAYGLGAGIFFIGYFLFEVPSNLILERVGARVWIARIMISWGVISGLTAFVTGPTSFLVVRFLLGVAEAGFFPGMILYLTYWFPRAERARIMGAFMVAIPVANVIGAPISTALLDISIFGLAGWQTMFIIEALPALLLGFVVLFWLTDKPEKADWLDSSERQALGRLLEEDAPAGSRHRMIDGLLSRRVWLLAPVYFGLVFGLYGLGFWIPQIIDSLGDLTNREVGLITVVPYLAAAVGMVLFARHSDVTGERAWHVAAAAWLSAAGFIASAGTGDPVLSVIALTVAAMGVNAALPVFWALSTSMLSGAAAASGIALINSVGNLSGYFGPFVVGQIRERTGEYTAALLVLSGVIALSGLLVLRARPTGRAVTHLEPGRSQGSVHEAETYEN